MILDTRLDFDKHLEMTLDTRLDFDKHLGMILDTRLDFNLHLKSAQNKVSKTIGLLRKPQNTLPRTTLITIFKLFISPHLDCGDTIYD